MRFIESRPMSTILNIVAAFGGDVSPTFAVPGECPWRARLRPSPTAALTPPSLYLPQAALGFVTVDFESTTSTNSITSANTLHSIHQFF